MDLQHIALDRLTVSAANMRGKGKAPDLSGILPSVRARGVLVPLIVRSTSEEDRYEIVAGRRRYEAAKLVAAECGESDPLPCAVIAAGDDASALEASLIAEPTPIDGVPAAASSTDALRHAARAWTGGGSPPVPSGDRP